MTGGFWYPYSGFQDANLRLGRFADRALGRSCGITYSDGQSLSIVRNPIFADSGGDLWLNVLREHVSVPRPPPPKPAGRMARVRHFFGRIFEIMGEAELAKSRANMAVSKDIADFARDHVWVPTHEFLLRHKLVADGVGVGLDVLGLVAGVAFVIAAAPVAIGGAGAAAVVGTIGLVTGAAAATGSLALLAVDGTVWGFELYASGTGNPDDEAFAREIEDDKKMQWIRIIGTVMLLPDIAVGGLRALKEIGKLPAEMKEGAEAAGELEKAAEEARQARAKIRNPKKHPKQWQSAAARANKLMKRAAELREEVDQARGKLKQAMLLDAPAAFVGSPGTAVLVAGAPPTMVLTEERKEHDESLMKTLSPAEGMPRDVKFELRVSGTQSQEDVE